MNSPTEAGPPDPGSADYVRWYRNDAHRVLQAESYEGRYHHHRRIRVVVAFLRSLGIRRVLDVGCGDGWQAEKLLRAGFDVVGTDISPERLRRARLRTGSQASFFVSDLRKPPLRHGSIECVYLGQVVEHLPSPGHALRELYDVLRPGGVIILDTPCRDNLVDDLIRISGLSSRFPRALDWGLHLDPGHLHFMSLREIEDLLTGAGFQLVASRGAPRLRWNTPRIGNPLAARPRLWWIHDLLESLVGWLPRYRRGGAIVVCAARRPGEEEASEESRARARGEATHAS